MELPHTNANQPTASDLADDWLRDNPMILQEKCPLYIFLRDSKRLTNEQRKEHERHRKNAKKLASAKSRTPEQKAAIMLHPDSLSVKELKAIEDQRIASLPVDEQAKRIDLIKQASDERRTSFRLLIRFLLLCQIPLEEAVSVAEEKVPIYCGRTYTPDDASFKIIKLEQNGRGNTIQDMGTRERFNMVDIQRLYYTEMDLAVRKRQQLEAALKFGDVVQRIRQAMGDPVQCLDEPLSEQQVNAVLSQRVAQYKTCYLQLRTQVDDMSLLRKCLRWIYCDTDEKNSAPQRFLFGWKLMLSNLRTWRYETVHENAVHQKWLRLRSDARRNGREFAISEEAFSALCASASCHYCGVPSQPNKPYGLDRVRNELGYTPDNVVPCCKQCNRMKSDRPVGELFNIAHWVTSVQRRHASAPLVARVDHSVGQGTSTYRSYRYGALKRGLKFELEQDYFSTLVGRPCYYCHRPGPGGIDRKNKGDPYAIDTVVPCCWPCNRAKSDIDMEVFIRKCELISALHPL